MKQMSLFHHLIDQIHQDQRIPTEEGNGEVKLEQMKKSMILKQTYSRWSELVQCMLPLLVMC